jgi:hypothetical protein
MQYRTGSNTLAIGARPSAARAALVRPRPARPNVRTSADAANERGREHHALHG